MDVAVPKERLWLQDHIMVMGFRGQESQVFLLVGAINEVYTVGTIYLRFCDYVV